jgi:tetratricopeptide (TPR) repeat protein
LEKCLALYRSGQDRELISVAEPPLQSDSAGSGEPTPGLAALWSLVGLSRQALHDEEGARAAFEAASHGAPEADKPIYRRYLATLTSASQDSVGDEQPADTLRRAVLWVVYGHIVNVLVQRQGFQSARRLIWEALADEELPADRREVLMELLHTTYTGEIDQLTTHALRTLQGDQEREALISLRRAEGLLSTIPEEALTPERQEEVTRHLWWGYAKLGLGRVEAGEFEYALEPLFHALRIGSRDRERQQEVRAALVHALEAVADSQTALIAQFVKDGKHELAVAEAERLLALINEGIELGLSEEELAPTLTKMRRAVELAQQG